MHEGELFPREAHASGLGFLSLSEVLQCTCLDTLYFPFISYSIKETYGASLVKGYTIEALSLLYYNFLF